MGDRDTQTQQEPSWWASDAVPEDLASSPSFDEPVEWPDAMAWEALFAEGPATQPVYVPDDFGVDALFGPDKAGGDDGGGGPPTEAVLPPLPASIWAPDPRGDGDGEDTGGPMATLGGSATAVVEPLSTPPATVTPQAGPDRRAGPAWMRRLPVRHRSAAVVALACCVSLVVLGMFLSVRARDNLPTQTTQPEATGGQIATRQPFYPVQPTTTATTAPPASISIADLVPAGAAGAGAGETTATTAARATAPATTAAPSRSAAPSGGGGAQQPTNTTAAPDPEPTSPSTTSPATSNTTSAPTAPPRTTPTFPDYSDYTIPSITMPDWQAPSPGSAFRTDN